MKKNLVLFLSFCILISPLLISSTHSQDEKTIYVIPVHGTIDLGLSAFIKRGISEARENHAKAVVFEIDTFGGRVDAADEIVNSISSLSPVPTYAYVTNTAWSAGALIALSCKTIIMKQGSSIGSAEPRTMGFASEQETGDEKIISALRAKFKSIAESNSHSGNLAQAMVDKDIVLVQVDFKGETLVLTDDELKNKKSNSPQTDFSNEIVICAKGKLLNLTSEEAKKIKLTVLTTADDREAKKYIAKEIFKNAEESLKIIRPEPTWSENLVRFLTHPIVSSLLLSLGFMGLLFELKIPGWGISGTLGVIFIVLFFWGHYLVGLANWLDILIFTAGAILLFIELFITPGFGIMGTSGIILIITGLILTMIKHPLTFPSLQLGSALETIAYACLITFAALAISFKFLPKTSFWKRITLEAGEKKEFGFQTKSLPPEISTGTIGTSKTILRPAGKAAFANIVIDVTTLGEFIEKDKEVKIVRIEGNKVFVERIKES